MIDELRYLSYKYNRAAFPDICPERWAQIFTDAKEMEERYQKEIHDCRTCARMCQDELNYGTDCPAWIEKTYKKGAFE
jgi:hypothetical protein